MKPIGRIRRSHVVSGNGPGAIIDFRGETGAPISVVAAGLEEWDRCSYKKGLQSDQKIFHEPLQARLGVGGFRLPPVGMEGYDEKKRDRLLPSYRFPDWQVCPKCERLQRSRFWGEEFGKPELHCPDCSSGRGKRAKKAYVAPAPFVVVCDHGHLQDFPWMFWPLHAETCGRKGPLKLKSSGAGLRGLSVHCTECRAERDLDGALSSAALRKMNVACEGRRPWLKDGGAGCAQKPVAIQRGGSNVYFPVVASALDVPPFGGSFRDQLDDFWDDLKRLDDPAQIPDYVRKKILPVWQDQQASVEDLVAKIRALLTNLDAATGDLRPNEYLMLRLGEPEDEEFREFKLRPREIPERLETYLSHLASVERLREVRVLRGFTRLHPAEAGESDARIAPLSAQKLTWLPAFEVRGEGIFVSFAMDRVLTWEKEPAVEARAFAAHEAARRAWEAANGAERPFPLRISPRFLLVHTTAHALAERLSLDSGYATASIRERLYVSPADPESGEAGMCGFLLYTSAPDADGTLGGLSRKGRTEAFSSALLSALRGLEWCSSDPLCASGILSLSEGSGLAACHCCVFTPETSCEHFNRHLDRSLLIGSPENPGLGFFRPLLRQDS